MLKAPRTVGRFEVMEAIGAGGMGEVYRARDPQLDRHVAIKVLSSQLSDDPAALARFEREATSIARVTHPNILSVFEFGRDAGRAFVAMELIEGETLRARLDGGPIAARRAISYALQMARGVGAAHTRGIVHRDLKPENVMITRDDQVKLLDFGLAKSVAPLASEATRAGDVLTSAGTVMGTFGYMAPEQVRGLAVDHRADIFALGATLYEMLSGRRAFKGETAADTMTAILTQDPPDLDTAAQPIPESLGRIVRRCLEKAPEARFQSAADLAFALENLSTVSSAAARPPVAARRPGTGWLRGWPWVVPGAALGLAAAVLWLPRPAGTEPPWAQFSRITEAPGEETDPTLSPDGSTVVFAMQTNGNWDLYAQRVGGRNPTAIVADPERNDRAPSFSPDGSMIAFHEADAVGGIFVAGATGESVRRLTDAGFDPVWSPDGRQIAYASEEILDPSSRLGTSVLSIVDASGGAPRRLTSGDAVQPSWSPSGRFIAYWSTIDGQRDLFVVSANGGRQIALTHDAAIDWCPAWSPDGRFLYFSSDRGGAMNLWRIPIDGATGQPTGEPQPVTSGVQAAAALPTFSKSGDRLVFRSRVAAINPVRIPFDPRTGQAGTPESLDFRSTIRLPSSVSPDGRQIAYFNIGDLQEDLFIGTVGGPLRRVTDDAARDRAPMFTRDGRSLLFYSNRGGTWAPWMVATDGSNLRQVAKPSHAVVYPLISPAGDRIVFALGTAGPDSVLSAPMSATAGEAAPLKGTSIGDRYFTPTSWSADGARLAGYMTPATGLPSGVAIYDFAAGRSTLLNEDQTPWVVWLNDGRRLLYFTNAGTELVVVDTSSGTRTAVDVRLPAPAVFDAFSISPDNRAIYYGAVRSQADLWLVERK